MWTVERSEYLRPEKNNTYPSNHFTAPGDEVHWNFGDRKVYSLQYRYAATQTEALW